MIGGRAKSADVAPLVAAAKPKVLDDEWADYMEYLRHSNSLVEKTYQLEKAGGLSMEPGRRRASRFLDERLAAGAMGAAGPDLYGVGQERRPRAGISTGLSSKI